MFFLYGSAKLQWLHQHVCKDLTAAIHWSLTLYYCTGFVSSSVLLARRLEVDVCVHRHLSTLHRAEESLREAEVCAQKTKEQVWQIWWTSLTAVPKILSLSSDQELQITFPADWLQWSKKLKGLKSSSGTWPTTSKSNVRQVQVLICTLVQICLFWGSVLGKAHPSVMS